MKTKLLAAFTLLNIGVQGWLCTQWVALHGFWGALLYWLKTYSQDPVLAAAVIDFVVAIAVMGILLLNRIPTEEKRKPLFFVWCAVYLVWPSIGLLLYLTWASRRAAAT